MSQFLHKTRRTVNPIVCLLMFGYVLLWFCVCFKIQHAIPKLVLKITKSEEAWRTVIGGKATNQRCRYESASDVGIGHIRVVFAEAAQPSWMSDPDLWRSERKRHHFDDEFASTQAKMAILQTSMIIFNMLSAHWLKIVELLHCQVPRSEFSAR